MEGAPKEAANKGRAAARAMRSQKTRTEGGVERGRERTRTTGQKGAAGVRV